MVGSGRRLCIGCHRPAGRPRRWGPLSGKSPDRGQGRSRDRGDPSGTGGDAGAGRLGRPEAGPDAEGAAGQGRPVLAAGDRGRGGRIDRVHRVDLAALRSRQRTTGVPSLPDRERRVPAALCPAARRHGRTLAHHRRREPEQPADRQHRARQRLRRVQGRFHSDQQACGQRLAGGLGCGGYRRRQGRGAGGALRRGPRRGPLARPGRGRRDRQAPAWLGARRWRALVPGKPCGAGVGRAAAVRGPGRHPGGSLPGHRHRHCRPVRRVRPTTPTWRCSRSTCRRTCGRSTSPPKTSCRRWASR